MQQERKMMSLEEVEAALMNINGGRPIYSEAMIAEQQAKQARIEQRREERLAKQAEIVCPEHTWEELQGIYSTACANFLILPVFRWISHRPNTTA